MKQLLFGILTLMIISCTSKIDLSNTEALEILKQDYTRYCEKAVHSSTYHHNNREPLPVLAHFKDLERQGLIILKEDQQYYRGKPSHINYTWEPTEEAVIKYKVKDLGKRGGKLYKMTEVVVKDIVGISVNQETKTAIVRFSYATETTPFQKIRFSKRRGCEITQGEEEVTFVLYDTGWKIQTEN